MSERELLRQAHTVRKLLREAATDLSAVDPRSTPGLPDETAPDRKAWSRAAVGRLGGLLTAHQEKLFAGGRAGTERRRMLLVLQATDCAGKDGTCAVWSARWTRSACTSRRSGRRPRRSGSTTSVADQPEPAPGRLRRGVQPLALRGRAGGAGARAGPEKGLAAPVRRDQPVRGDLAADG
jgi:hypothetical protein